MIRCLIVDDDLMSRKGLEHFCGKEPEVELVGSCENVESALSVMKEEAVDLIFLDVEMPGETGFDLLDQLPVLPYVIIVSSKEQYAFDAFQYQVTDYLKKPVTPKRFRQALDKLIAPATKGAEAEPESIFIKSEGRYIQVALTDIDFIENVGDYVRFHTDQGTYIVYSTMKNLAGKLPSTRFMRVHRSYIVNLRKIVDIEEGTIVIKKSVIPVSRANRPVLLERLNMI